jgi:hypothetical protein
MLPQRGIEGYCLKIDKYDKRVVLVKMIVTQVHGSRLTDENCTVLRY